MTIAELTAAWTERFSGESTPTETFGTLTVDVPPASWLPALEFARSELTCEYFDWLTGVDELEDGFRIVVHVYSLDSGHHLLIRTLVPRLEPTLHSATPIYRGAGWHERETYEMFGVLFEGHPDLKPLLLPEGFQGNPLRKDFVLAARVAKPWPGAKEPGESSAGAPSRRRVRPPGVPDDWGPQAAAPAPARPDRPTRRGAGTAPERGSRRRPPVREKDSTPPDGAADRTAGESGPAAGSEGTEQERRPRGVEGGGDA